MKCVLVSSGCVSLALLEHWGGEDTPGVHRAATMCSWTKPLHTLRNPLQLALRSQRSRTVKCVVYDDFLSEQQSFQPLGEKERQRANVLQLLSVNATSAFSLQLKWNLLGSDLDTLWTFYRKNLLGSADSRGPIGSFGRWLSFGWRDTLCLRVHRLSSDASRCLCDRRGKDRELEVTRTFKKSFLPLVTLAVF